MANRFLCVLAAAASFCLAAPTSTQAALADYFGGPGTALSTNIAYFCVPNSGGSVAGVTALWASADGSTARLKVYSAPTVDVLVTNALAAGLTNILVASSNGLAVGDVIVIRHVTGTAESDVSSTNWQKAIIGPTITAAGFVITNDLTSATTSFALAAGDHIYRFGTPQGNTCIGNTVTTMNGGGSPVMVFGAPGLIEVSNLTGTGTNNCLIVGGKFFR